MPHRTVAGTEKASEDVRLEKRRTTNPASQGGADLRDWPGTQPLTDDNIKALRGSQNILTRI